MARRKIALVGIGKIARDQHLPAIATSPDWDLAATVSPDGGVDGIDHYTEIGAMLTARPDIGVVSLCVPPVPRFDVAAAAIRAGRHVMLEKPPAASVAESETLARMAGSAGTTVFASWHSREAACVAPAKAWLKDRAIRRLVVTWKEDVRRWHPGQDWIFARGGLGVFDPGINALSILTEILPAPLHVRAARLDVPANREAPIAASLDFTCTGAEEARAVFDFRQQGPQTWSMEIETDGGLLALHYGGSRMEIDGQEIERDSGDALATEYPRLYARMAVLLDRGESDMDLRPLVLVADAFLLGERRIVEAFDW
ncbi:MAG: Gfo/Idh/MocA family oxidoreductase [Rhodospirillales bacterium]